MCIRDRAGIVRRRGDDQADAGLARALLASGKDAEEHEYAVHSVARALAAHCTDLDVPARPHVLELANVQHLATHVTGRLADAAPVLALPASPHPTAAVCGTPTERALVLIRQIEGMDRGRYAGPVGWLDSHGDGEFGIALRCAEVTGNRLRLFAGCGIVAGSDPVATSTEAGVVRVSFAGLWDRDDATLTYDLYRDSTKITTISDVGVRACNAHQSMWRYYRRHGRSWEEFLQMSKPYPVPEPCAVPACSPNDSEATPTTPGRRSVGPTSPSTNCPWPSNSVTSRRPRPIFTTWTPAVCRSNAGSATPWNRPESSP